MLTKLREHDDVSCDPQNTGQVAHRVPLSQLQEVSRAVHDRDLAINSHVFFFFHVSGSLLAGLSGVYLAGERILVRSKSLTLK